MWRTATLLVVTFAQIAFCVESFTTPHHTNYHFRRRINPIRQLCSRTGGDICGESDNERDGIRLNKVFKATHSRREADKLIESGRVCINGTPVQTKGGMRVIPYRDEISLDGKIIRGWERMNAIDENNNDVGTHGNQIDVGGDLNTSSFEYVKYYKPRGVTCTTDLRIDCNIIDAIRSDGYHPKHRVYPVGRLDKDTSGLIILTSDGRMVNSVLRGERKQEKVYNVMVNGRLDDEHLQLLRVSCWMVILQIRYYEWHRKFAVSKI